MIVELPEAKELQIDRDGQLLVDGRPATHAKVAAFLLAHLECRGGQYLVPIQGGHLPVAVEDTPFVVRALRVNPAADKAHPIDVELELSDGSSEPLKPATLWLDKAGVPRCLVKDDRWVARLSTGAWLALAPYLHMEGDRAYLVLRGERHAIRLNGNGQVA